LADYLLDTHACVYSLAAPERLGKAARRALEAVEAGRSIAWIPAAVVAEIVLLRERDRIGLGLPQLRMAFEQTPGLKFLALDFSQIEMFAMLTAIKDPFDRFILSACRVTGARLITRDNVLLESKVVPALWD
jgi:PIN domain nuclease of toxin-antitoxin system